MSNPFTVVYDWLLLTYIRILIAAELGPVATDVRGDAERARLDFIAHGGDPEYIEAVEKALDIG